MSFLFQNIDQPLLIDDCFYISPAFTVLPKPGPWERSVWLEVLTSNNNNNNNNKVRLISKRGCCKGAACELTSKKNCFNPAHPLIIFRGCCSRLPGACPKPLQPQANREFSIGRERRHVTPCLSSAPSSTIERVSNSMSSTSVSTTQQ